MTLVEFISPLLRKTRRDQILGLLYFCHRYKKADALTVEDIRSELRSARVPGAAKVNVADVLAKSAHFVDSAGTKDGRRLWKLTDSGFAYVRQLLGLPEADPDIEVDAGALRALVDELNDADLKGYLEEALNCLQVGALRATVVFLWSGAMRILHGTLLARGSSKLNSALQKHDPKSRTVNRIDDFSYVKDRVALLAALDLGLIDKSEKDTLDEALSLRNRCGHPGKYRPGPKKVSSFVEDLLSTLLRP